jgi:ribonuclease HI
MSAHLPGEQGAPQPFLNREAAGVTDFPTAVHQAEHMEIEVEAVEEASDENGSSSDEVEPDMRHSTMVYFIDIDPLHCRPRWNNYEALHMDITNYANKDMHDLARVHIVGHPPEDLQMANIRPVIAQQPHDVTEGSTFQLTLLDVVFHNALPSLEAETVRRVKLLPRTISRKALLAVLGLQPYCKYVRQTCLVWHNRRPVKSQAKALIDLRHGDYLQVAVPPGRGELKKQYTRDVAQCFRRGYRASNIPVIMEAYPEGVDVSDMPVIDTFNYIPRAEDLDYDRDAMTLMQITGISRPALDPWPSFLSRQPACAGLSTESKIGEEDRVEAAVLTVSHQDPPAPAGIGLRFGNEVTFLQELHPIWAHFAAVELEEEGRVLYVQTWYSDHDRFPTCESSRPARLLADPWRWLETMAEVWDDRVDPDSLIDFYAIFPRPRSRDWEDNEGVQHVLLVQYPHVGRRSTHITHVDPENAVRPMTTFVTTVPFPVRKVDFYDVLGINDRSMVSSLVDCAVWHGDYELDHVQEYPNRHGLSFIVIQNHLRDIVRRAAASSAASSSHAPTLLQTQTKQQRLHLFDMLEDELPPEAPTQIAVQVRWLAPAQPHPDFLMLPSTAQNAEATHELVCWGLQVRAVLCRERDQLVCLPCEQQADDRFDYVLVNLDLEDEVDILVHTARSHMTSQEIMSTLYKLGFWRAVIVHKEEVHEHIYKIQFKDQKVNMMEPKMKTPRISEWPTPQICLEKMQPYFHAQIPFESTQFLDIGITLEDLQELFQSHQGVLQPDLDGLDLPDEIQKAISACDPELRLEDLDRLLIYADGSSLGTSKHVAPLRAEEEGTGDTWAYVVVGERYDPPGLCLLGWNAQPVLYDPQHSNCLGAQRIGADIAEKEALTWASLWRLSQNWTIPTCFRSDSRVALGQAEGTTGTACLDDNFVFLRSSFQAIEAALGPQGVLYAHVPGHSGEVWNELCDWLAKRERQRSFYCRRPKLNMDRWRKAIAHLWLALRSHPDLPAFCGSGLHAPAPSLPPPEGLDLADSKMAGDAQPHWTRMKFTLSACTANVQSLSAPPQGHGGKLDFLRQQFIELGFNFLGIQESKTDEFCSCVDNVYRLSAGQHNHQQGVELWVHLQQPYGYINGKPQYFTRTDFQIVFKDARTLLVHVDTPYWNGWLLVAYAPQSGLPLREREAW